MSVPKSATGPQFKTLREAVLDCHNWPALKTKVPYWRLHIQGVDGVFGRPHPDAVSQIEKYAEDGWWQFNHADRILTLLGADEPTRSANIAQTMGILRNLDESERFFTLSKWRNELEGIFMGGTLLALCERAGTVLLGLPGYGAHMTVFRYRKNAVTGKDELVVCISIRASNKATYPGMWDDIGGCQSTDENKNLMSARETMEKEALEEAGVDPETLEKNLILRSVLRYCNVRDKPVGPGQPKADELVQWDTMTCFHVEVGEDFEPRPNDGEVEKFVWLTVDEVKEAILEGHFKPNGAVITLDFFKHMGLLTPEEESCLDGIYDHPGHSLPTDIVSSIEEINQRCGRAPLWHKTIGPAAAVAGTLMALYILS